MKIGIVAGESSGDYIAATLMDKIKEIYPLVVFEGMAGPKMVKAGCTPIVTMEQTAVMGFGPVIGKLYYFYKIKKKLINHFKNNPPDLYIGIDFTEFNLHIAKNLKKAMIKTVQYKGPSVWAWRANRVRQVEQSIDLLLTIFPFEQKFYSNTKINAVYVGHPMANEIPMDVDTMRAREKLYISNIGKIVAILPGSRKQEIASLAVPFLKTAKELSNQVKDVRFVCAHLNESTKQQFHQIKEKLGIKLDIIDVIGCTRDVISASDAVLVSSGTATFETMLFKKPMVVAYKMSLLLGMIVLKMLKTEFISLPNILFGRKIVDEYIQSDVNTINLTKALIRCLDDEEYKKEIATEFQGMHKKLQMDTSKIITENLQELLSK